MPVKVGTAPIRWLEYLQKDLPTCPYKPSDVNMSATEVRKTHEPSRASLAACSGKTKLHSTSGIIDRFLARDINAFFAGLEGDSGLIIPEEDHTQPLFNEQGVGYVPHAFLEFASLTVELQRSHLQKCPRSGSRCFADAA
jgi:hypothetical protein